MLKLLKTPEELVDFIKDVRDDFGCVEDWQDWFGFELAWNEETGEILETIEEYQGSFAHCPAPQEYPVVISYLNEHDVDLRERDWNVQVWDWISVSES